VVALAAAVAALLVGVHVVVDAAWLTDGVNHTAAVKRLWDTGGLGALPYQAGGLIVGEAYAARFAVADHAALFDAGLCAALVIGLLGEELAARRAPAATALWLVLAIPIALNPEPTVAMVARWSGTLFHLAAFFALQRAFEARRPTAWIAIFAAGLAALRWEFVPIAGPYAVAGLALVSGRAWTRRAQVWAAAGWIAVLIVVATKPLIGAAVAIPLTALALVGAHLLVPAISRAPVRSAIGVLAFVVITASLAPALGLIAPIAHSGSALSTLWFAAAVGLLQAGAPMLEPWQPGPQLRLGALAIALALLTGATILWPNFHPGRRERLVDRYLNAAADLRYLAAHGYDLERHRAVARLQAIVPAGVPVVFSGRSAGALDFARNPIVDLSAARDQVLPPLPRGLDGGGFAIIEDVATPIPTPRGDLRAARYSALTRPLVTTARPAWRCSISHSPPHSARRLASAAWPRSTHTITPPSRTARAQPATVAWPSPSIATSTPITAASDPAASSPTVATAWANFLAARADSATGTTSRLVASAAASRALPTTAIGPVVARAVSSASVIAATAGAMNRPSSTPHATADVSDRASTGSAAPRRAA
jgi:hypothetical protein